MRLTPDSAEPFLPDFSSSTDWAIPKFLTAHAWKWATSLLLMPIVLEAGAAWGATRVTLAYGILERSISTSDLETYAREGTIPPELKAYLQPLAPEQRNQFRQLLETSINLNPVAVSQFLYTTQGETLLRQLGEVIRTESNLPGFYALRSALILAAAQPEGLTLLNVVQQFPVNSVRVDLTQALNLWISLESLIEQTQQAIAFVKDESEREASRNPHVSLAALPDLRLPGHYSWDKETIQVENRSRQRSFPADIYLPKTQSQAPLNAPVVVISHGLGSDRSTYAYLAQQLASYGFVVAVPEHPGSNADQLQALISGRASQVIDSKEFIDRPLDIKDLLNVLEERVKTEPTWMHRLNLQQVGVVGQSMGGYTALALAGATINSQELLNNCPKDTLNLSLLLQCRALELPHPIPNLQDDRVKAIVVINPIGSSLFGSVNYAKVRIPVTMISSSADTVAPCLFEQVLPFTWLQTPNKYLLLLQGGTHFSTIDVPKTAGTPQEIVELPRSIVGPDPAIAHAYLKTIGVAFFSVYLANQTDHTPYLTAAYMQRISNQELPIRLIQSLDSMQLAQALKENKPEAGIQPVITPASTQP